MYAMKSSLESDEPNTTKANDAEQVSFKCQKDSTQLPSISSQEESKEQAHPNVNIDEE